MGKLRHGRGHRVPTAFTLPPPGIPRCSHLEGSPARLRGARLWGEGRVKGGRGGKGGGMLLQRAVPAAPAERQIIQRHQPERNQPSEPRAKIPAVK